jgi:hypothetical protein
MKFESALLLCARFLAIFTPICLGSISLVAQDRKEAAEGADSAAIDTEKRPDKTLQQPKAVEGGEAEHNHLLAPLRAILLVENALVKRACKPTEEQQKELDLLDNQWLNQYAASGSPGGGVGAGVMRLSDSSQGVIGQQPANQKDRITMSVREAQQKRFAEVLSPEQYQAYQREVELRRAFRRNADAEVIVALLDERLLLSERQRTGLILQLRESPQLENISAAFYLQNVHYVPQLPLPILKEHLTLQQLELFQSMQTALVTRDQFNNGQEQVVIGLQ